MFAVREDEVFVVVVVFAFGFLSRWLVLAHKMRTMRLKTIQLALETSAIDDSTRRELIATLHADARRSGELWRTIVRQFQTWVRTILFVGGWLTFIIGGLFLVGMYVSGESYMYAMQPAAIATAVGFALVTLPVAMAELERSRQARVQR